MKIATWNLEWLADDDGSGLVPRYPEDYAALASYAARLDADIIAVQEVDGSEAIARVFDPEIYDIHLAKGGGAQRNGFVFRKTVGAVVLPDLTGLGASSLRAGADLEVELGDQTIRLLGVHLKSGCLPSVRDIDGDGDLDIASAEFFANLNTSFAWYERVADPSLEKPAGQFVRHVIDDDSGPSIQLSFVEDFFGDGVLRAVGANHTNTAKSSPDPWESAVFAFAIPEDPRTAWPKTQISTGIRSRPRRPLPRRHLGSSARATSTATTTPTWSSLATATRTSTGWSRWPLENSRPASSWRTWVKPAPCRSVTSTETGRTRS